MSLSRRTASITRNTNETKIQLSISLDGGPLDLLQPTPTFPPDDSAECAHPPQKSSTHASQITNSQHIWIWTGIGFLDHMLHAWTKHAGWSLRIRCRGDLVSKFRRGFLCCRFTSISLLQSNLSIKSSIGISLLSSMCPMLLLQLRGYSEAM